jgi:hypothetical protein
MVYLEYDVSVFSTTYVWNIFHDLQLECAQKCHTGEWLNKKKKFYHQKIFLKTSKYKIVFESIQHFSSCYKKTDGQTWKS